MFYILTFVTLGTLPGIVIYLRAFKVNIYEILELKT